MIIDKDNPAFSDLQNVKRRFYALRNGAVADTLRRAGDPHRIIFGLTLLELRQTEQASPHTAELARILRENSSTRESRLLAPMLMPIAELSKDEAFRWLSGVMCAEEADILCHSLLRKTDFALSLANELYQEADTDLKRYAALRLMCNLMYSHRDQAKAMAEKELANNCALTTALARQIIDELNLL